MSELKTLMERAASRLSGHPVKVRWRRPARARARAGAFRSGGTAFIDLHPGLTWDGETLLYVLCHESGHVRDLWHEWSDDFRDLPSGSVSFPAWTDKLPVVVKMESTADDYARQWLEYGYQNYAKHWRAGDDKHTAALRALGEWRE